MNEQFRGSPEQFHGDTYDPREKRTDMKKKNPSAVALGKLAKGKPKNYSPAEIKLRTKRLLEARNTKTKN